MNEQQVLLSVDNYREEYIKAEKLFGQRGKVLESKANSTAMQLTDMDIARQMIHQGVEITTDYFVACEAIIFALDAFARPLLKEKISARAVGAVAALMQEIVQDMEGSSTSFNVSLNGRNLGTAGIVLPKPGIQAKSVQIFWKQQYQSMPDYSQEEARREQAERDEERREEQAALEHKAKIDAMQMRIKQQNQESRTVEARRSELEAKCVEALDAFKASAKQYLEDFKPQLRQYAQEQAAALRSEKEKLKIHKKSASGRERKKLAEQITALSIEEEFVTSEDNFQQRLLQCKSRIERAIKDYEDILAKHLDRCYRSDFDEKSVVVPASVPSNWNANLTNEQWEIQNVVEGYGWQTISEIQDKLRADLTNQQIAANLRLLMRNGLVVRVEHGSKAYFGPPGTPFRPQVVNWTVNESLVKGPLPAPAKLQLKESDYDISEKVARMVQVRMERSHRSRKKYLYVAAAVIALIAAIAAFLICGHRSNEKASQRLEQAREIAQTELIEWKQNSMDSNAYWVEDYGVTDVQVAVEDIVFVSKQHLIYDYQTEHYQVKVRIDCTATDVGAGSESMFARSVTRSLPGVLGQVDDYYIRLWAEMGIKDDVTLLGGDYDGKYLVFIYLNGKLVQGPIY